MTQKPSKVLIIGSGPIIIGHFYRHSEGAKRLKNLVTLAGARSFAEFTLSLAEGIRMTLTE